MAKHGDRSICAALKIKDEGLKVLPVAPANCRDDKADRHRRLKLARNIWCLTRRNIVSTPVKTHLCPLLIRLMVPPKGISVSKWWCRSMNREGPLLAKSGRSARP